MELRTQDVDALRIRNWADRESSLLAAAKGDPNGFVADLNPSVTLDEIQHAPELFPVIKAAIDQKQQPGRLLLAGSANVILLPKLKRL